MGGMNSQIHLYIETDVLGKLRLEAQDMDISVSELIRRKLADSPTTEEIILIRKLKRLFGGENGK